jgi:hypothetical protein
MYHWDGPGAIPHHDHLLSISALKMLQWTPGEGREPTGHRRWWPLYHKTVEAGKKVFLWLDHREDIEKLRREFGPKLKQFLLALNVPSVRAAEEILKAVSRDRPRTPRAVRGGSHRLAKATISKSEASRR